MFESLFRTHFYFLKACAKYLVEDDS